MHTGRIIFAQLMDWLPRYEFTKCVRRHRGHYRVRTFSCLDQFLCMAFAQLTFRESLRDIETCLRALQPKLYHAGLRCPSAAPAPPRLYALPQRLAFFVVRAKRDLDYRRCASHPVDRTTGLRSDQSIRLRGPKSAHRYPAPPRRITHRDAETDTRFVFLTNHCTLPALTIADLYHRRWRVELFFKWLKQHLRLKGFYGLSENAVKTQVWIALSVYVLVAIIKKELKLDRSLGEILQILSLTLFEKEELSRVLTASDGQNDPGECGNQLNLFDP